LTPDQKKTLASLQKEVDERIKTVLSPAQKKQLEGTGAGGGSPPSVVQAVTGFLTQLRDSFVGPSPALPAGVSSGSAAPAGKILSPSQQQVLKLTPEQRQRLQEMQKDIDAKLAMLLTAEQRRVLEQMQKSTAPPGPAVAGSPGPGGPRGNPLFRAYRFGPHHPGLAGKQLTPGKSLEELQQPEKKETRGR
jgi:hypothetical protein